MASIDRRTMLALTTSGLAGSRAEARDQPDMGVVEGLLTEIRDELRARTACASGCPEVLAVRAAQQNFVKAQGHYPRSIEVGFAVFEAVHDWLRTQPQPLDIARLADNRYRLTFGFTALMLRTDANPEFVGFPMD